MITQQQVEEAKSLLLSIVNQAMARGLFNSIEDMPKVLDAITLNSKLWEDNEKLSRQNLSLQNCLDTALLVVETS